jgi:phosphoribosylformylglycinamidine synthase
VALAECCIWGNIGARITPPMHRKWWSETLFGEGPARVVITCRPEDIGAVERMAAEAGVTVQRLGEVGGLSLSFEGDGEMIQAQVADLRSAYEGGLPVALEG